MDGLFDDADFPHLLVGLGDPDDAAVWDLGDGRALVVTTDFFTPVVDTPYEYGAIAAANALSDIYAMGGKPFLALNVAALPPNLPPAFTGEILRGGAEKAKEAGVVIAGGHTVQDKEPKYGLIVLGFADPAKMFTKGGAKPGDVLVLSKPLGFGTTTTAIKQEKAALEDMTEVIEWMTRLNRDAAELALELGVCGATDITGFSFLGHAWEMASASKVGMRFPWEQIPFISGAKTYAEKFIFPGGASDNKLYFEERVQYNRELADEEKLLLFDPQTSGGLLLSVPAENLETLQTRAKEIGQPLWVVGEVIEGNHLEIVCAESHSNSLETPDLGVSFSLKKFALRNRRNRQAPRNSKKPIYFYRGRQTILRSDKLRPSSALTILWA
jgi:selenide,water dikinase